MLRQFFEYARYLKPVMKLFIAALAAGALAAAASGFGFPLMIAKVFPVVFDNTQIPPELQDMIARLVDVTSGSIFLDGEDITHLKGKPLREVYRTMQMVFQTPADSFDPRRTLGDGIGESLRNAGLSRKETREKVEALLKDCGLPPEYADRYPHQVSGGQCQRAAIARALAIAPRLLICDEITSALDVTVQKEILELLNALRTQQGRGLSILFISHDISLVQQFCDRVLVMYRGEIVEEGTPDEVIRNPQNDYTKRLIDSVLS